MDRLGHIDERSVGTDPRTVVFIQDAHDSLEAQSHISDIIQELTVRHSIQTVFEEGYEQDVPTAEYFGSIKDDRIRERVAYYLMDHLRLGGAEFAHIRQANAFRLIGVDSFSGIQRHQAMCQAMLQRRDRVEADLAAMEKALDPFIRSRLPSWLREGVLLRQQADQNLIEMQDYFRRLWHLRVRKLDDPCSLRYPALKDFMDLWDKETVGRSKPVIRQDLQRTSAEIALFEKDFFSPAGLPPETIAILEWVERIRLLRKLFRFELSQEDLLKIQSTLKPGMTQAFLDLTSSLAQRPIVLSRVWEDFLKYTMGFYQTTFEREAVLDKALASWKQDSDRGDAILVYGGFHREAIIRSLRRLGISYVVISPRITSASSRHQNFYRQLVGLGYLRYEYFLGIGRSFRAPSFFAIVRDHLGLGRSLVKALEDWARQGRNSEALDFPVTQEIARLRSEMRQLPEEVHRLPDLQYPVAGTSSHEAPARIAFQRLLFEWQQAARAGEAEALLGRHAAGVFHDANNALAQAMMALELAMWNGRGEPDEHLSIALTGVQQATQIMRSALSLVKKGPSQQMRPLDVREPIQCALDLTNNSLKNSKIVLKVDLDAAATTLGSLPELTHVFLNLINNAEQAILRKRERGVNGSADQDVIRVTVKTMPRTHQIVVLVTDTGIGIKPEDQKRLFEEQFTTRPDGNGWGLLRVMEILQAHQGHVEFNSEYGFGTRFRILLPLIDARSELRGKASFQDAGNSRISEILERMQHNELAGRYLLLMNWKDLMSLTPQQFREDIEKMLIRYSHLRLAVFETQDKSEGRYAKEIQRLQRSLGGQRIVISAQEFSEGAARLDGRGQIIQIMGKPSSSRRNVADTAKQSWVRFRYEGDEIGVVAAAVLYAEAGFSAFVRRIMTLSGLNAGIREAIAQYLSNLVISRSA